MNDPSAGRFMTTHWTEVLSARGNSADARQSLKELCERYYTPVYAFILSYTHHDENALDWTHSFFAKLLEGRSFDHVVPNQGRFRSYLLGAVKHFIADERERSSAQKRGGSIQLVSHDAIRGSMLEPQSESMPPDAYFDRQWALSILDQSLRQLENECGGPGARDTFEALKPWLNGGMVDETQAEIAERLGVSRDVVKKTLHRWRSRFREIVKSTICATVDSPAEVDQELAYLIHSLAFASSGSWHNPIKSGRE